MNVNVVNPNKAEVLLACFKTDNEKRNKALTAYLKIIPSAEDWQRHSKGMDKV